MPSPNVSIVYTDAPPLPTIQPSSSRPLIVSMDWVRGVLTGLAVVVLIGCFDM